MYVGYAITPGAAALLPPDKGRDTQLLLGFFPNTVHIWPGVILATFNLVVLILMILFFREDVTPMQYSPTARKAHNRAVQKAVKKAVHDRIQRSRSRPSSPTEDTATLFAAEGDDDLYGSTSIGMGIAKEDGALLSSGSVVRPESYDSALVEAGVGGGEKGGAALDERAPLVLNSRRWRTKKKKVKPSSKDGCCTVVGGRLYIFCCCSCKEDGQGTHLRAIQIMGVVLLVLIDYVSKGTQAVYESIATSLFIRDYDDEGIREKDGKVHFPTHIHQKVQSYELDEATGSLPHDSPVYIIASKFYLYLGLAGLVILVLIALLRFWRRCIRKTLVCLCGGFGSHGHTFKSLHVTNFALLTFGLMAQGIGAVLTGFCAVKLSMHLLIAAMALSWSVGASIVGCVVIASYAEILGERPQGVWMGWIGAAGALGRVTMPLLRNFMQKVPELAKYRGLIMFVLGGTLIGTAVIAVCALMCGANKATSLASEFEYHTGKGDATDDDDFDEGDETSDNGDEGGAPESGLGNAEAELEQVGSFFLSLSLSQCWIIINSHFVFPLSLSLSLSLSQTDSSHGSSRLKQQHCSNALTMSEVAPTAHPREALRGAVAVQRGAVGAQREWRVERRDMSAFEHILIKC